MPDNNNPNKEKLKKSVILDTGYVKFYSYEFENELTIDNDINTIIYIHKFDSHLDYALKAIDGVGYSLESYKQYWGNEAKKEVVDKLSYVAQNNEMIKKMIGIAHDKGVKHLKLQYCHIENKENREVKETTKT